MKPHAVVPIASGPSGHPLLVPQVPRSESMTLPLAGMSSIWSTSGARRYAA